jgi:hypothetical protein
MHPQTIRGHADEEQILIQSHVASIAPRVVPKP